jgi:hypothetical protein
MATINKDFKIKSGLIVEGTTATVNGNQILTENASDTYILNLIGGETLVKSVAGSLSVDNAGELTINLDGLSQDLAGTRLYADGSTLNVDVEGIYDDMIVNGLATTTNVTDAINTEVTNRNDAIATAKGEAGVIAQGYADTAEANANDYTDGEITTALTTAQGYATTAQDNAEGYADGLISTEVSNRNSAISTAKGEAISDANDYTDVEISTEVTNRNSAISTAITNLDLAGTYDALGSADQALADANTYTDGEIAALVDSAPALLDTLNELAAAIADNPNYATDAANAVAGRVAKSGDTMTGDLVLPGAPTLDLHASTKKYVDDQAYLADMSARGYADGVAGDAYDNALADANSYTDTSISNLNLGTTYDAYGAADGAEEAANLYTDGEITTALTTAQGYADAAETAANGYTDSAISTEVTNRNNAITSAVDALTTSDIEEGTNLYFTDSRAKTSAADLLTGASLTNITITGTGAGLTITAENGVAQSTTFDLAEDPEATLTSGTMYLTQNRVLDSIDNSVITPQSVTIDTYRKEEATQQYVSSASTVDVHSIAYPYESVKYLVRVVGWVGGVKHSQVSEILMTVDGNKNIAITEYGTICTDESPLATFSARSWTGSSDFSTLTATTAVSGCEIIAAATMLSWAD